jgi:hypothetical protein
MELGWLTRVVRRARQRRGLHLFAANLRIFIGFAMLPAGLKKVLGEPFTDPGNTGPFHDFLHAFHDTGAFYPFVGLTQVLIALLLMTQRFALVGAMLLLPVLTTILVFCWSTAVYPTASVVTMMWLGNVGLFLWDIERWRGVIGEGGATATSASTSEDDRLIVRHWALAGFLVFALYGLSALVYGGIYRPRGFEAHEPAFWVLVALLAVPVTIGLVERRAFRIRRSTLT